MSLLQFAVVFVVLWTVGNISLVVALAGPTRVINALGLGVLSAVMLANVLLVISALRAPGPI